MKLKNHPDFIVDKSYCSKTFYQSLVSQKNWDELDIARNPKSEYLDLRWIQYYTESAPGFGLSDDPDLDPRSDEGKIVLHKWCEMRVNMCCAKIGEIDLVDGWLIKANRIIQCDPLELNPALGIFWSWTMKRNGDPRPPWGDRDKRSIIIEGLIPVDAVMWNDSIMKNMCWWYGDEESELRLHKDHPIQLKGYRDIWGSELKSLPDLDYRS